MSTDSAKLFDKILVANRGEIACRVMRTAKRLGIRTVAVYSEADANAVHVRMADEAVCVGPAAAAESYLNMNAILDACARTGAQAVHPGYGFLSENAKFARALSDASVAFVGPPVFAIESMGSKSASKDLMTKAGVPVTPGYHGSKQEISELAAEAEKVGYPLMVKAVLGGGGKGMRVVHSAADLEEAVGACQREAKASFGDERVLLERFLPTPRHVELQVFADKHGNAVHVLERDCSVQRRHQKVLEEAPAPGLTEEMRHRMGSAAVAAAKAVGYEGAGTVEFMYEEREGEEDDFFFLEMNTRLQVEHPVTEMISGLDLVEWQLRVAAGQPLPLTQEEILARRNGCAIEARVYAENPSAGFLPATGTLRHLRDPSFLPGVRVDTGVEEGSVVSVHYDPMISKLIAHGEDRADALRRLQTALRAYRVVGLPTNLEFLARTAGHPDFVKGGVDTSFLSHHLKDCLPLSRAPTPHAAALAAHGESILRAHAAAMQAELYSEEPDSPWAQADGARPTSEAPVLFHFEDAVVSLSKDQITNVALSSSETTEKSEKSKKSEKSSSTKKSSSTSSSFQIQVLEAMVHESSDPNVAPAVDIEVRIDNRRIKATVVIDDDETDGRAVHVFCDDGLDEPHTILRRPRADLGALASSAAHSAIVTPMPGKVAKLMAKPGQAVEENAPLVILEAMKMEHVLRAPTKGVVDEVRVKQGDFVEDGKVMITFQDPEETK